MKQLLNKLLNWLEKPNVLATVKTITYKIISSSTTFALMYMWTGGNVKESGSATLIMMAIHMAQFWIHERIWLIWENRRKIIKE